MASTESGIFCSLFPECSFTVTSSQIFIFFPLLLFLLSHFFRHFWARRNSLRTETALLPDTLRFSWYTARSGGQSTWLVAFPYGWVGVRGRGNRCFCWRVFTFAVVHFVRMLSGSWVGWGGEGLVVPMDVCSTKTSKVPGYGSNKPSNTNDGLNETLMSCGWPSLETRPLSRVF